MKKSYLYLFTKVDWGHHVFQLWKPVTWLMNTLQEKQIVKQNTHSIAYKRTSQVHINIINVFFFNKNGIQVKTSTYLNKTHSPRINKCSHQGARFPFTVKYGHSNYWVTSKSDNIVESLKKNPLSFEPSNLQIPLCFPLSSVSPFQGMAGKQMKGIIPPSNTSAQRFHFLQPVENIPGLPAVTYWCRMYGVNTKSMRGRGKSIFDRSVTTFSLHSGTPG